MAKSKATTKSKKTTTPDVALPSPTPLPPPPPEINEDGEIQEQEQLDDQAGLNTLELDSVNQNGDGNGDGDETDEDEMINGMINENTNNKDTSDDDSDADDVQEDYDNNNNITTENNNNITTETLSHIKVGPVQLTTTEVYQALSQTDNDVRDKPRKVQVIKFVCELLKNGKHKKLISIVANADLSGNNYQRDQIKIPLTTSPTERKIIDGFIQMLIPAEVIQKIVDMLDGNNFGQEQLNGLRDIIDGLFGSASVTHSVKWVHLTSLTFEGFLSLFGLKTGDQFLENVLSSENGVTQNVGIFNEEEFNSNTPRNPNEDNENNMINPLNGTQFVNQSRSSGCSTDNPSYFRNWGNQYTARERFLICAINQYYFEEHRSILLDQQIMGDTLLSYMTQYSIGQEKLFTIIEKVVQILKVKHPQFETLATSLKSLKNRPLSTQLDNKDSYVAIPSLLSYVAQTRGLSLNKGAIALQLLIDFHANNGQHKTLDKFAQFLQGKLNLKNGLQSYWTSFVSEFRDLSAQTATTDKFGRPLFGGVSETMMIHVFLTRALEYNLNEINSSEFREFCKKLKKCQHIPEVSALVAECHNDGLFLPQNDGSALATIIPKKKKNNAKVLSTQSQQVPSEDIFKMSTDVFNFMNTNNDFDVKQHLVAYDKNGKTWYFPRALSKSLYGKLPKDIQNMVRMLRPKGNELKLDLSALKTNVRDGKVGEKRKEDQISSLSSSSSSSSSSLSSASTQVEKELELMRNKSILEHGGYYDSNQKWVWADTSYKKFNYNSYDSTSYNQPTYQTQRAPPPDQHGKGKGGKGKGGKGKGGKGGKGKGM